MKSKTLLGPVLGATLSFFAALTLSACQSQRTGLVFEEIHSNANDVIYGEDNRADLHGVSDTLWLERAESTVALMRSAKLVDNGDGTTKIDGTRFGDANMLCEGEPFIDQKKAAFCSGFLVAPDTVVTAGHCIRTAVDCSTTKFVFGFSVRAEGQQPESVPTSDVYGCKKVIRSEVNNAGTDMAIVKLDRAVSNRQPLALRQAGTLAAGDGLVVIGHPAGLPLKVADGASVRLVQKDFIVANTDTYGGNSGSAVFNAQTGEVEGILVRGEQDFVWQDGCYVSKRCEEDECRGEDVTKISNVLPYLNGSAEEPSAPPSGEPAQPELGTVEFSSTGGPLAIADGSLTPIESAITVTERPQGRTVLVTVAIEHAYRGDLEISIVAPDGSAVLLKEQSYFDSGDVIEGTFGLDFDSVEDMSVLSDVAETGKWVLRVRDAMSSDTGSLLSWKLTFVGQE